MYSESDLDDAVAAGTLSAEAADALRAHVAAGRETPAVDEESFRLITGFNDIFVSIAAVLLLVAVGWIGSRVAGGFLRLPAPGDDKAERLFVLWHVIAGTAALAATAWGLAEYFTRRRRMALPSILLLLVFAGAFFGLAFGTVCLIADPLIPEQRTPEPTIAIIVALSAMMTAGATWGHWRRFRVPITIAVLATAGAGTLYALTLATLPKTLDIAVALLLPVGLGMFAYAMWWDMSDRERRTRRSDVAFWLHLAAAPLIAHPVFRLLGLLDGEIGTLDALMVIVLYIGFGLVALAVDRRALLVSSLAYVLYALSALFRQFGAVSLNVALTALVIGSALLMLSAFWQQLRRQVVSALPDRWQARLPALDRRVSPRPA